MKLQKFLNNYSTRLAQAVSGTDSTLVVEDELPQLGTNEFYRLTLFYRAENQPDEIVEVSAVGKDGVTLTVIRAVEGGEPKTWNSGTPVEMRLTAGQLDALQEQVRKNKLNRFLDL